MSFAGAVLETQHVEVPFVESCTDGATDCVEGEPQTHDQSIALGEVRLHADLGLTSWLAASVMVPLRIVRSDITYLDVDGNVLPFASDIHHRDETLVGLGDPWVLLRHTGAVDRWRYGLRLGVSLPFGRTEPDPYRLGELGLSHQHVQDGTGTFDPIAGLEGSLDTPPLRLHAWAIGRFALYENEHGYRAGQRVTGHLGLSSALGTSWLRARIGTEASVETPERWHGQVPEGEGNQGRLDVVLATGLTAWTGDVELFATVRTPLVTHVEGGQLRAPLTLELGVAWSPALWSPDEDADEDEHGHDHGGGGHDHDH